MNTLLTHELIDQAKDGPEVIALDREQTAQFYDERGHWGKDVRVSKKKGDLMILDWMATPERRGYTKERYFINNTEIKPAFDFWGLANTVRGRNSHYVN